MTSATSFPRKLPDSSFPRKLPDSSFPRKLPDSSFPRKRESRLSISGCDDSMRLIGSRWIPAFAGMTTLVHLPPYSGNDDFCRSSTSVQHCECARGFGVLQNASVTCHEPRTSVTGCRHQNAIGWIGVRITRQMRAPDSNAWCQFDYSHAGNACGRFDPLQRIDGQNNSATLGEHRDLPDGDG